jgi:hypothetical protein
MKFYYVIHWSDGARTRVNRGARGWSSALRIAMAHSRRCDARAITKHPNAPGGEYAFAMREFRRPNQ